MPSQPTRSPLRNILLILVVLAVIVLRHDYWQWDTPGRLLFGILPVGLWWQAMVSVLAAVMMAMLVRWAWPADLHDPPSPPPDH